MSFWKNKKVLITGGSGFIGSCLADLLVEKQAIVRATSHSNNLNGENFRNPEKIEVVQADLLNSEDCSRVVENIDVVFNLAAIVGGIQFNLDHPAKIIYTNNKITSNMLEATRNSSVERSVIMSSSCVYPDAQEGSVSENLGFVGLPDGTKFGYAWSKRFDEILAKAYSDEYSMKIGIARPFNVYGPRDVFDPAKAHVIPSIIKQIENNSKVKIFGNGKQERSFIFVKDVAEGLSAIAENYPKPDAINLGTDEGIKIIDLVKKISLIYNKDVEIEMVSKTNPGSMKRICDVTKAKKIINFKAKTGINEGLKETIEWFKKSN